MRVFVSICVILILYFGYKINFQETQALEEADLLSVLKTETYQTRRFKASLEKILPSVELGWSRQLDASPHVVMLGAGDAAPMEPEDAIGRVESILKANHEEGVSFVRWCLFMSSFSDADKELIFEKAIERLPYHEGLSISRDVMNRQAEPAIYEKALTIYTKDMQPPQLEKFVQEQWPKTTDSSLRAILSSFADTNGILLR